MDRKPWQAKSIELQRVQHNWSALAHMDCSPPGSSVHGISQARILMYVVISFSRRSSNPCLLVSCIGKWILYCWATREALPFLKEQQAYCIRVHRNGRDLTEAEVIKKRWQEYTEELYKKDLYDPDNHDGVITHLEPDILECEVKWALGSIITNKASGGDGIPVELFRILKDDAVKVLHSICQQIWKTQHWPQDWKRSVFIPIPKKGNAKECSNYRTIALISHVTKVMLKILQARLQQYVNHELPDVQAGFRKGRGAEIKLPTSVGSSKKTREFQKNIFFCFIDYAKAFDYVDHNKLWKILREMGIPDNLTFEKPVCRSGSNS